MIYEPRSQLYFGGLTLIESIFEFLV